MSPLKTFTIRLSLETIREIEILVEDFKSRKYVGKVNRQTITRLAISKGIEVLLSELGEDSHLEPSKPLLADISESAHALDEVYEGLDNLSDMLETIRKSSRPVIKLLENLDDGVEALERLSKCGEAVEVLERLSQSDTSLETLERLAKL